MSCLPDHVKLIGKDTPEDCCSKKSYFRYDHAGYFCGTPNPHLFREITHPSDRPLYQNHPYNKLPCRQNGTKTDNPDSCCSKIVQRVYLPDKQHWYQKCDSPIVRQNDTCIPDLHEITSPNKCCSNKTWYDPRTNKRFCDTRSEVLSSSSDSGETSNYQSILILFVLFALLALYFSRK